MTGGLSQGLAAAERQTPRFDMHRTLRVRRAPPGRAMAEEETVITESVGLGGLRILTTLDLSRGEIVRIEDVTGPFRIAVRVRRVSSLGGWIRAHLAFLGGGSSLRDWLIRARVLPPPQGVTVEAPFLDEAQRLGLEVAAAEAFIGVPGRWQMIVAPVTGFTPPWWLVTANGTCDRFVLSLSSAEQRPRLVCERLRERLRARRLTG